MSNKGGRGFVFFVLLGVVALAGGFVVWRLASRGGGEAASRFRDEDPGARGSGFVGGIGTTWSEEERGGDATGALEGTVVDADGKPVDGARVTLGRARGRNEEVTQGTFMRPRGEAVTSDGGRFKIDGLAPGEYAAGATADGWAPAQAASIAVKEREIARVELRLAPGGIALEGRVLDVGGGAVGGARIVALSRATGGPGRAPILFQALSAPDGQYRLSLARGPYGLRVEADGYAPTNEQAFVARATKKDLRLVPAARLVGRIVERGTRRPIADAEVSVTSAHRMDFKMPREGKSDAEGRFAFTDLEPGTYEIMGRSGALVGAGTTVTIAVAQVLEGIEVELDRGYAVAGRVKDERGAGIGGALVSASRAEPPFGQASRTRTRPDGSFALEGLIPGRYRLSASAEEGFGSGQATAKVLTGDAPGVEIVLPAATKVEGRVTTADGRPAAGARVSAMIDVMMPEGGMMATGDFAVTEADGRFELKRAMPGRITLNVRHDEHGSRSVGPEEMKPGERRTFAVALARGGTISGLVKTADGRPAADVMVRVRPRDGRMFGGDLPEISGPDGRYRITGLPAGRMVVEADRTGRMMSGPPNDPRQQTITLADGEEKTGVDLVVAAAGQAVSGSVVAADGSPVAGATIVASVERGDRAFRSPRDPVAYSAADGQFTLEDVDGGGTYTLRASHPAHPEAEVKGIAAGATGVKLPFPADASVAGIVVGPDGKPLPHYTITILPGPKADEKPEERRRRQMGSFDARTQRVQAPDGAFESLRHRDRARDRPGEPRRDLHARGGAAQRDDPAVGLRRLRAPRAREQGAAAQARRDEARRRDGEAPPRELPRAHDVGRLGRSRAGRAQPGRPGRQGDGAVRVARLGGRQGGDQARRDRHRHRRHADGGARPDGGRLPPDGQAGDEGEDPRRGAGRRGPP
jgi:protocatechuate 3,4-dioxygenase beta subunit